MSSWIPKLGGRVWAEIKENTNEWCQRKKHCWLWIFLICEMYCLRCLYMQHQTLLSCPVLCITCRLDRPVVKCYHFFDPLMWVILLFMSGGLSNLVSFSLLLLLIHQRFSFAGGSLKEILSFLGGGFMVKMEHIVRILSFLSIKFICIISKKRSSLRKISNNFCFFFCFVNK